MRLVCWDCIREIGNLASIFIYHGIILLDLLLGMKYLMFCLGGIILETFNVKILQTF